MIQIILTPEQQRLLAEATEPVEIVDGRGRILSRIRGSWTDAEISEALQKSRESGLGGSLSESIAELERAYPIPERSAASSAEILKFPLESELCSDTKLASET